MSRPQDERPLPALIAILALVGCLALAFLLAPAEEPPALRSAEAAASGN